MRKLVWLLALGGCTAPSPQEHAQQRQAVLRDVPGQHPTLAAALAAAGPGDRLRLAPGSYAAGVVVEVPDLSIEGAGAEQTTLRGTVTVAAEGFRMESLRLLGDGEVWGVRAEGRGVELEALVVEGFTYGISVVDTREGAYVEACTLQGNQYGVYLRDLHGRISNNLLLNNLKAGGFSKANVRAHYDHNTVVGNGFASPGDATGGLVLGPGGREQVRNNIVVGNHTGLRCARCGGSFHPNIVWGNQADYAGLDRGRDDLAVDPRFVQPAARDFHLRADSPAIDGAWSVGLEQDRDGAPRPAGQRPDFGAYEYQPPTSNIVITEVLANARDEGSGEFVELYNAGDAAVDLAGYGLADGDSRDLLEGFEGGPTLLAPGAYAVVLDPDFDGDFVIAPDAITLTIGNARIGNGLSTGDPVRLRAPGQETVVSAYEDPFDPGDGISAERVELDGERFVASPCGHSPGRANCIGMPPAAPALVLLTEVMANPLDESTGEYVELLNLGDAPLDLTGFTLSDGDSPDPIHGPPVPPGGYAVILDADYAGQYALPAEAIRLGVDDARLGNGLSTNDPITLRDREGELVAAWQQPFNPGNGRSAELADPEGEDWIGAPCGHSPGRANCAWDAEPPPMELGDLRINEVMANPLDEDRGEFVELYNAGEAPIDLAGLVLDDGDATDTLEALDGGATTLAPGAYAVIMDPEHGGVLNLPEGTLRIRPDDTTLGSGLATNDTVTLRSPAGEVIDAFTTPANPGNGRSLEFDGTSWVASPCAAGSSPGARNCALAEEGPGVIINEVMANPLIERSGEFVELLNLGDAPVDLAGYRLSDGDSVDALTGWADGPTVLAAGAFALILDPDAPEDPELGDTLRLTVSDSALGNGLATSDPVTLLEPDGVSVVDAWTEPFNPGNGRSAERNAMGDFVSADCPGELQASPGGVNCVD